MKNIDARYRIFGSLFLLSNRLETVGNWFLDGLTTKQWFFMAVLDTFFEQPPTISELAAQMGSSHQNVKQLALRLKEKGFVDVQKDQEDKRALRVIPTAKASDYAQSHHQKDEMFIAKLFDGFSVGEADSLLTGLDRLYASLSRIEKEHNKDV
ncbi:MAG: MarR family transcriptional regulator [Christensenella sp.]|uniref:MarR family winged helix-turn-helix transcriptional regulator n=1 Tax=Christensenella sp. TaxID=1935934 RepID=UPI002B21B225|nr:MarR family transcriptional regulator [Christensenella sp.]MEA5002546.1 MarR family transcriptional regulator [Christensenella sp.]